MGVVCLSPSLIATLLILFSWGTLLYQLLFHTQVAISYPIFLVTSCLTALFSGYEFAVCLYGYLHPSFYLQYRHSWIGLFLIFTSCFFYMILCNKSLWYIRRGSHAKSYWEEKTDMVGELGSQLHN